MRRRTMQEAIELADRFGSPPGTDEAEVAQAEQTMMAIHRFVGDKLAEKFPKATADVLMPALLRLAAELSIGVLEMPPEDFGVFAKRVAEIFEPEGLALRERMRRRGRA